MGFFNKKNKKTESASSVSTTPPSLLQPGNALKISLKENLQKIKEDLGNSTDIVFREFRIGKNKSVPAGAIYTDGLTDTESLERVIKQLIELDIQGNSVNQKKTLKKISLMN
jgi:spore germination protein KA